MSMLPIYLFPTCEFCNSDTLFCNHSFFGE